MNQDGGDGEMFQEQEQNGAVNRADISNSETLAVGLEEWSRPTEEYR